tara:strand:+ start:1866 stop:3707 length:1842 start_codon:yes stop_codon:yes gene_type:complete
VQHLKDRGVATLFLDPGLGKTSITLSAFSQLQDEGVARKMLVIAPLRVCQLVWEQEAARWTQFTHLKFTMLHGPKKLLRLQHEESDVYLINPEGCAWLAAQLKGKPNPFDTVTIDEITKFKNGQAVRSKALGPMISNAARKWGLTGTPIPNGYLDLWGQFKVLDGGGALGQWFSHYRNKYFEKDYSGFSYTLRRGSTNLIEKAIAPYVLRLSDDELDLPPLVDVPHIIRMPAKARQVYNRMKKDLVAELPGGKVEAGNVAAVYSKLKQMGNGAVYSGDGIMEPRVTIELHDAKIEALVDLVEELQGTPVLVAYEFKHDLIRLKKALGKDTPYIGSGVSGKQAAQIEQDWNNNELPVLLVHPASAGHGLNLQKGDAHHIAWFSVTWDYELYDQLCRRLHRQGNNSVTVFNHLFIVEDTIDIKSLDAIQGKQLTQNSFLSALQIEICPTDKPDTPPDLGATEEEDTMATRRLSRRGQATAEATPEAETPEAEAVLDTVAEETAEDEAPRRSSRRTRSAAKLTEVAEEAPEEEEEEPEVDGKAQFSPEVREKIEDAPEAVADDPAPEPAPKTPRRKKAPVAEADVPDTLAGSDIDYDLLAAAVVKKLLQAALKALT